MIGVIELEVFCNGKWHLACQVEVAETSKSFYSNSCFSYDLDYYFRHAECDGTIGVYASSLRHELSAVNSRLSSWPSFLLDLMPQGAARSVVCNRERIVDNQENDFDILVRGAINPVGNIRVKSKHRLFEKGSHSGFSKNDIIEKNENFLEHAEKLGALVIGTSGAQGVSLKFLLNVDELGMWHCDGAIADNEIKQNYLVKFPRGKNSEDRLILHAEKIYMDIATDLNLKTNKNVYFEDNALFVPRFDREFIDGKMVRYGLESISSAIGHTQFGQSEKIENYLEIINECSSSPKEDILEFIGRDFLNIVLGNTDNHGRNTAFLKKSATDIRLSPLYDFAPMVMDSEMIARSTKWSKESNYIPDFFFVKEVLIGLGFSEAETRDFLSDWYQKLRTLPELLKKHSISEEVVNRSTRKYEPFINALKSFLEIK